MSKILTIIPTTGRRLSLIDDIINRLVDDNKDHDIQFVVIKNGNFPQDVYESFKFKNKVIKENSEPAANISSAQNKGLLYLEDHEFVLILEDDFLIKECNFLNKIIEILKNNPKIGSIGGRLHGTQKRNFKQIDLEFINNDFFEVYWTDGFLLSPSLIYKNFKYDENFHGATEMPDFCLQLIEAGYKNFYIRVQNEHFSIPESNKYIYASIKIDPNVPRKLLVTKWSKSTNNKIKNFIKIDG